MMMKAVFSTVNDSFSACKYFRERLFLNQSADRALKTVVVAVVKACNVQLLEPMLDAG